MRRSETIDFIASWLKDYCLQAGMKGFVIGVSGGIDSAVTSALAAHTGLPLLCVEMPIHQPADQVTRALEHIQWLEEKYGNIRAQTVNLSEVFDSFIEALPKAATNDQRLMALVNTRARLRMTALYYFAGLHQYLVVGTGNKVEDFGIGFYTKYGDGGVDLSPIADLYKSQVYELGEELGIIPSIMGAAPTDGLWGDDRTDEDQIGASYPELEWAMEYLKGKEGKEEEETEEALSERQQKVLEIYQKLNRANQHKMVPIPVCKIPDRLFDNE